MLGTTMLLSVATFAARRVTAIHGAAHLVLFAVYAVTLLG
jgi:Ca2+:H+ antiporter